MLAKMMSFLQLAAEKRHHFGEHDKQIFGPSYFVTAYIISTMALVTLTIIQSF